MSNDKPKEIRIDKDDVKELAERIIAIQHEMEIHKETFAVMLAMVSKHICDSVGIEVGAIPKEIS